MAMLPKKTGFCCSCVALFLCLFLFNNICCKCFKFFPFFLWSTYVYLDSYWSVCMHSCRHSETIYEQSLHSLPIFFSQENFICILNLLCKRYITSFEQCSSNACPFAKYFHMFFHHHSSQSPELKINSSVWWPIRPVFLMSQWPFPK